MEAAVIDKCPSMMSPDIAKLVRQRWELLRRFSEAAVTSLPFAHTGWTAQPHTLGARLCVLRSLILWDHKLKLWEVRKCLLL